jgi:hypothetical protein
LLARRRDKVSFERCATLGRQHYFVDFKTSPRRTSAWRVAQQGCFGVW